MSVTYQGRDPAFRGRLKRPPGEKSHDSHHQQTWFREAVGGRHRRGGIGGTGHRPGAAGHWRCQSMWSAAELTYKVFQDFCERVKTNTNGRLVIEPFSAGAVTGVFETLDAVSAGVLQAHSSWPGYFSGKDAGLAVISDFVFGYEHPHQAEAWFYYRGGLDMLRQAYAKY